jgi:hypothetical protein
MLEAGQIAYKPQYQFRAVISVAGYFDWIIDKAR